MISRQISAILLGVFWPFITGTPGKTHLTPDFVHDPPHLLQGDDLEPWTYFDDFEDRDLGAWASYPLWQDIAYNQNFRVNEIVPGDENISIVQKVTPYAPVDNYAGAQKLLDMYLVPEATIQFRYYLKTNQACNWFKVRLAGGELGKLDVTLSSPKVNEWEWVTVNYQDIVRENPVLANKKGIRIYALAFLAKFSKADPDMPIYLGLDDINFQAARVVPFQFNEPLVFKLPEFQPYIPQNHYYPGDQFNLSGTWSPGIEKVTLEIASFSKQNEIIFQEDLTLQNELWKLRPLDLSFPEGVYLGKLIAYRNNSQISETLFTLHIAPARIAGHHPRLLFNAEEKETIDLRFKDAAFTKVLEEIGEAAREQRLQIPVESLHFDLDQFPDEDWLPTWDSWGNRIYHTGSALRLNARAYAFLADREAGVYVKALLLKLATWPNWTHPWQTKRGRFSEHRTGSWSHRVAEAYDLVYDLMNEEERLVVRKAIFKNIIEGVHRTYIYNDNITAATSNWLAMTVGGSLMCMSAIFADGQDTENLEPYFTGALLKLDRFLNKVTDSEDGAWGEGYGYNNYSFSNLSYSLPSLEHVFNIDLSKPLRSTYNEYIWAGLIKEKRWFEYGDSRGNLTAPNNWAYLLSKYREPRLSWFYHFLKNDQTNYVANQARPTTSPPSTSLETYEDVIFNTTDIPTEDPFEENPVKLFREIGTSVFKSGWEKDDFVFVMRTGPGYNHQHLDQGSFWLADRGQIFIEERSLGNSDYYDDPLYESWLTQPIGHSTILINGNPQSQRMGDHKDFAPGFDDYAFVSHFLDGEQAAFTSGNIGRLYWDKVSDLQRNVLYLKPRVLLMLDVAIPAKEEADITLLYQTAHLSDIQPGEKRSTISKEGVAMQIFHLSPESVAAKAEETPHYLKTLRSGKPLEREGMLTVTARTNAQPLVFANLITTTTSGDQPELISHEGDGYITSNAYGQDFAFSTHPDRIYATEEFKTDALAISWSETSLFAAKTTYYEDRNLELKSEFPMTFEYLRASNSIKFYLEKRSAVTWRMKKAPAIIYLNNESTKQFRFDNKSGLLQVDLPPGEGTISFK